MAISKLRQLGIAGPSVGSYGSSGHDVIFDKSDKRFAATVRHNTKPQASRIDAASVNLAILQTRPNLNSADYNRFVMLAPTSQAEVFEVVALVLQFVLVDRQPQERRRPAVTRDQAQSQRRLIVGVEIGPVHRHDDRLALAHDLANPWREQVPDDDPGVAQQAIDLFDRVSVCSAARF